MQDSRSSAHPLGETGVDDARMPHRILMYERTSQYPGDDLHVLVRVGVESHSGRDDVVVVDQEKTVVSVLRVVVIAERERVLRVQPAGIGLEAIPGSTDIEVRLRQSGGHGVPSEWCGGEQVFRGRDCRTSRREGRRSARVERRRDRGSTTRPRCARSVRHRPRSVGCAASPTWQVRR